MPYTTLTTGTTIAASWANANVRDQVVTPFATAAARASAISSPIEGMMTFLNDVNRLEVYNGTAWIAYFYPFTDSQGTSDTTTSTAYTDLGSTGPILTVTTGAACLVTIGGVLNNNGVNPALMAYAVTGASSIAASDSYGVRVAGTNPISVSRTFLQTGLTPGSNIFTAKYRVAGGTGTYLDRSITVFPGP